MDNEQIIRSLVENSKAAIFSCIELHNKPIFSYRYETCIILNINAWELLLKAYLLKNCPDVSIYLDNETTKPFEKCVDYVLSDLGGNKFLVEKENLMLLYYYRCNVIHFYKGDLESVLCSILSKNILMYSKFLHTYFEIDIASECNLILLPIGFKPITSPIDFLSKKSNVKEASDAVCSFIMNIMKSTNLLANEGISETVFFGFTMKVENENRLSNADIIAGITKDDAEASLKVNNVIADSVRITDEDSAKKISIDEESVFKSIYTQEYSMIIKTCKNRFKDFKQNKGFNDNMKKMKNNPTYHKARYLDVAKQSGTSKNYYTVAVYDFLAQFYEHKKI